MPHVNLATSDPKAVNELLSRVESLGGSSSGAPRTPSPNDVPEVQSPPGLTHELCGWYYSMGGDSWTREFEVRELTGRDEERLSSINVPGDFIATVLELGLVRVGPDKADRDVVDVLLAIDWATVFIAIRRATFGDEFQGEDQCQQCGAAVRHTFDLGALEYRRIDREGMSRKWTGRHGTSYQFVPLFGAVQRKILSSNKSAAALNTIILRECVETKNDRPVIADSDVIDIPLADRRSLIKQITDDSAGPVLEGVKVACPECGVEREVRLDIAALFR